MKKEDFRNLLIDLLSVYNKDKIKDVELMVDKYAGLEFDAIKTLFIKYNSRLNVNYDPTKGTDKHVIFLIAKYNEKERVLLDDSTPSKQVEQVVVEAVKEEDKKQEIDIDKISSDIERNLKEKLFSEINKKNNNSEQNKNILTLKLDMSGMEMDFQLPPEDVIKEMGVGERIITKSSDGKICGLEIAEIIIDCVSEENRIIKEVKIVKI